MTIGSAEAAERPNEAAASAAGTASATTMATVRRMRRPLSLRAGMSDAANVRSEGVLEVNRTDRPGDGCVSMRAPGVWVRCHPAHGYCNSRRPTGYRLGADHPAVQTPRPDGYVSDVRALVGHRLLLLPAVSVHIRDDAGRLLLVHQVDRGTVGHGRWRH